MSVLDVPVHVAGGAKPFGELTLREVADRAGELEAAVGFGPTRRVAPVARAWAELAERMRAQRAPVVRALGDDEVAALAERLWIAPPL